MEFVYCAHSIELDKDIRSFLSQFVCFRCRYLCISLIYVILNGIQLLEFCVKAIVLQCGAIIFIIQECIVLFWPLFCASASAMKMVQHDNFCHMHSTLAHTIYTEANGYYYDDYWFL